MPTLYLIEQNTVLRKTGHQLLLCKKPPGTRTTSRVVSKDILLRLPCADVDHIMLFGNIQVTTQTLHELLYQGIELALFSFTGNLLGQLTPPKQKNIFLRIKQFKKFQNNDFCLTISKKLICSKLAGMTNLLYGYYKNYSDILSLSDLKKFKEFYPKISAAQTPEQLLGYEGAATAIYFKLFGSLFKEPYTFQVRSKRPPKNEINAVLSFGYVCLAAELQALLDGIGFEPFLGFYHKEQYGRASLALDLLEELRHTVIDRLVLTLFNKRMFKPEDFFQMENGGVYLSTSGKRTFFTQFEKMQGRFVDDLNPNVDGKTLRHLYQKQLASLVKTILHNKPFMPLFTLTKQGK